MPTTIKHKVSAIASSFYNSYSQIFFSNNSAFGIILLLGSFLNLQAGLAGLLAVAVTNLSALLMGLNKKAIESGSFAFNSLLVGLGLGLFYEFNIAFFFVLIFASMLTLMLTVLMQGWLGKYTLPYLSFPFLFGIWLVSLASRQFKGLSYSEAGVDKYNEIFLTGGRELLDAHMWFTNLAIPDSLLIYFQSLGAIFFQYTVYAGIVIAIGLLIASRISFVLSLLGFYSAYLYYHIIGADLGELNYGYIGFNYILTSIAIGGFFVVPSFYSYLWALLLTPVISLFVTGSGAVLGMFQLSAYSLPFNMVVILFLYALKFRDRHFDKPFVVNVQEYSPEKNLYSYLNYAKRFLHKKEVRISLPFKGKWIINQGHEGDYTHKDEWKHAWDFIIEQDGKEFRNDGKKVEDYFCYGHNILAPADGTVEAIIDLVADNKIGEENLKDNWGNSIVIRHSDTVFSQMSHLMPGSFRVMVGQKVKAGDVLAQLGNSGRSAYPHLHFQIQAYPFVGSRTLDYPIGSYFKHTSITQKELMLDNIPRNGEVLENLEVDYSLRQAFHLEAGQILKWESEENELFNGTIHAWEAKSDLYKNTYLECMQTQAKAYFKASNNELYFTHFKGNQKSALYYFYLAGFKVFFTFDKDLVLKDVYPTISRPKLGLRWLQDMIAPFYRFEKSIYHLSYTKRDTFFDESKVQMESQYSKLVFGKTVKELRFVIDVEPYGIHQLSILKDNEVTLLKRIESRD